MRIQISGDTLALDRAIRGQIESQARALTARFSREPMDLGIQIAEEMDRLHGHRVRCEVRIQGSRGRQWIARAAEKDADRAISESFNSARKTIRRTLLRTPTDIPAAAAIAAS